MKKLNFEISEDLDFISKASNIDWSILVEKIIKSKIEEISKLKEVVSKSKLTDEDVKEFTDKINSSLSQKYL